MLGRVKEVCEVEDGMRGAIPMALARNVSLEKLKQVWEPKALGQCIGCFWSLHPVWDCLGSTRLQQQGRGMEGTGRVLHPPLSKLRPTKSVRSWRGFYKCRDWSYTSIHNFLT